MKNLIGIVIVSATVAAIAVPALSRDEAGAKPVPQSVQSTMPTIPGSVAAAVPSTPSFEKPRAVRVVYPGGPTAQR